VETFWQDIKYGARMLAKNPGFAVVAVLTLALGIGATSAIFSVVSAVLLEPPPYTQSDRLVIAVRKKPGVLRTIASYPDFTDWQQCGVFAKSAAVVGKGFFLDTPEGLQPLSGRRVTPEFFDALGVRPLLGRGFLPDEARQGKNVAVISHRMWSTHLGGDPQVVGKDLWLREQVFRVIGVLPPDFLDPVSPLAPRDLYVPLVASNEERVARNSQWLQVVGRLREGVNLEQAAAVVEAASERAQREIAGRDVRSLAPFTLIPLREHHVGTAKPALWLLPGAVGFVLLIGCANVSNLLLARITARQHELAVRAAVGASARRLAAQLMTESLLLSLLGGTLGLVLVLWMVDLVKAISPVSLPRLESAGLNLRVFGFALLITVAAGLLFGLLPILRATRHDVLAALKLSTGTAGVAHARSRSALLIAEVALTMVLLVGATLAVTSFQRLLRIDPGFQTARVLAVSLTYAGEWKHASQRAFFAQLIERVRALPGVRAAGVVDNLPFSGAWSQFTTHVDEFANDAMPEMKGKTVEYQQGVIGGDYFRVMGIPLKAGRFFDERDAAPGAASVIVSESLARTLWGDADPLGHQVSDGQTRGARIVGVVGNVRHFGLDAQPVQTLYRPLAQREAWGGTLVVLTEPNASSLISSIRESVREVDRAVVFQWARTMEEFLASRTAAPRFLAVLLGAFGGVALVLASLGIYGVLACSVSQRTREIGVRIALGAAPGAVLRMVVRNGMVLAGIGVCIGLAEAFGLSRFLREQLFEVSPVDPFTYGAVALFLLGVALLSCWVPARRAAHVDPMVALRFE
jgi:putative ABC transport system permease protein